MNDASRARLHWRCRRGLLELDLRLGQFLHRAYDTLTVEERTAFARLLDCPDDRLLSYIQGNEFPADPELRSLVIRIRQ